MNKLAAVLDAQSYEWLSANHPEVCEAVEIEVGRGRKPDEVRRFVLRHTSRLEFAIRCEAAARYLATKGDTPNG